jgi:hypothetical protein
METESSTPDPAVRPSPEPLRGKKPASPGEVILDVGD